MIHWYASKVADNTTRLLQWMLSGFLLSARSLNVGCWKVDLKTNGRVKATDGRFVTGLASLIET